MATNENHWCEKADTWYRQAHLHKQTVLRLLWRLGSLEAWISSLPSDIATNAPAPLAWTPATITQHGAVESATCEPADAQGVKVEFSNFTVEAFGTAGLVERGNYGAKDAERRQGKRIRRGIAG